MDETSVIPDLYESLLIPEYNKFTSISKSESEFMYNFLKENSIKKTLEVGFSYGCSTAYIISATQSEHYAIDPYQHGYDFLGIKNIKNLGLDKYLIHKEGLSHAVLPALLDEGIRLEFAFVDGGHKFDEIFIDFYYLDLLVEDGGYILLHDFWMYSTQMLVAWIRTNKKNFREIPTNHKSMVLLQKIKDDNRKWHDFEDFTGLMNVIKTTDKKYYERVIRIINCQLYKEADQALIEEFADPNQV